MSVEGRRAAHCTVGMPAVWPLHQNASTGRRDERPNGRRAVLGGPLERSGRRHRSSNHVRLAQRSALQGFIDHCRRQADGTRCRPDPPRLWPRRCRQDGANEHSCAANRRLTAFTPPDNKFTLPSHRGVIVDARGQRGRSERRETGAAMQLTDETVGPPTPDPVCGRHLFAVGDGRRGTRALRRHRCASRFCFAAPPQTHSPRRSTPISRPSVQKA